MTFYPRDKDLDWECSSDLGSISFSETETDIVPEFSTKQFVTSPPDSPFAASHWKGSCDLGQLTLKGALQQRALGRALRGIYIDRFKLLSDHWDPDQLWVRSTSKDENTHTHPAALTMFPIFSECKLFSCRSFPS